MSHAALQYGALGLCFLILGGIYLLINKFAPKIIDALVALTTAFGAFGEKLDGYVEQRDHHQRHDDGTTTGQRKAIVEARRGLNGR